MKKMKREEGEKDEDEVVVVVVGTVVNGNEEGDVAHPHH